MPKFNSKAVRVFGKALLILLLVTIAGEVYGLIYPKSFTSITTSPSVFLVQLRRATLPSVLRPFAVHYWFVAFDPDTRQWERWEVWQNANAGGTSWGHVHKNLMPPDEDVGGGPYAIEMEWQGTAAQNIYAVLNAPTNYPHKDIYRAWPGPNSNTYIAWVIRQSKVPYDLEPRGIGKDYLGYFGGSLTTTRTGAQIETPIIGAKAGLRDGVEMHLLCFTLGVDWWTPALKSPLGRFGFPEPSSH